VTRKWLSQAARWFEDSGHHGRDLLQMTSIGLIKRAGLTRVEIQDGYETTLRVEHGNHELRSALRVAGDMTRKRVDISDQLCLESRCGNAAHSFGKLDLQTADWPLVGTDPEQFRCHNTIKAYPTSPREILIQYGGDAGHRCNGIGELFQQASDLGLRPLVTFCLFLGHDAEIVAS
jgi:hypothetical protein